jgi:hypothetical protein
MCFSYSIPIILVATYYDSMTNNSVSAIICNSEIQTVILCAMVFMGVVTILYEFERADNISTLLIGGLLFGIYGLVSINEENPIHYIFAGLSFFCIFGFMYRQCYIYRHNVLLFSSVVLQLLILFLLGLNMNNNIFYYESFYIFNFAVFYLYLHTVKLSDSYED